MAVTFLHVTFLHVLFFTILPREKTLLYLPAQTRNLWNFKTSSRWWNPYNGTNDSFESDGRVRIDKWVLIRVGSRQPLLCTWLPIINRYRHSACEWWILVFIELQWSLEISTSKQTCLRFWNWYWGPCHPSQPLPHWKMKHGWNTKPSQQCSPWQNTCKQMQLGKFSEYQLAIK